MLEAAVWIQSHKETRGPWWMDTWIHNNLFK